MIPYVRRSDAPSRWWGETPSLFEGLFRDFQTPSGLLEREGVVPAVDILEKDGNLVLKAELPGIEEKNIELKLDGNVLTLKGEKKFEEKAEKESYHRVERHYGAFTRSFTLPDSVDRDKIKADCRNGVLTIVIPQKAEMKPREIPVTAG